MYDITFTLTTGTSAPTGSFTFDPTVGPDGTFSDFIVNHRGVAHNFTAKANAPSTGGCASGASGFDILAGLTACPSNQVWAFYDYENQNVYALFASNASLPADLEFMPWMGFLAVSNSIPNGDGADDGGTFTIAARNPGLTVSEPMTLLLVGLSVAGLSAMRRRGPARTVG
ncbi:MAG: PEP-CTERM sorting domain-containing protein [Rubrivivax sp.]